MTIFDVLSMIGGLCLFLFGMNVEDIKQTDVNLAFIPYHHAFGCTAILVFLSCGAKTAFCDGLRHIPENLREYKVTVFVCVPLLIETMYKKVEKEVARQGKTKLIKTMRKVCNCLEKVGIKIRRKIFKPIIRCLLLVLCSCLMLVGCNNVPNKDSDVTKSDNADIQYISFGYYPL